MTRILLILLLSLTAFGQPSPINRRAFALTSLASSPGPYMGSLAYWWVASDVPDGTVNSWTDRIQGIVLTNSIAGNKPFKTNFYVAFTNKFLSNSINSTLNAPFMLVWVASSPGPYASIEGFWMTDAGSSSFPNGFYYRDSSKLLYFNLATWDFSYATNDVISDVTMVGTNVDTYFYAYTNAQFLSRQSVGGVPSWTAYFGFGNSPDQSSRPWTGRIYELLVYTNTVGQVSQRAQNHTYFTNRYGYTP